MHNWLSIFSILSTDKIIDNDEFIAIVTAVLQPADIHSRYCIIIADYLPVDVLYEKRLERKILVYPHLIEFKQ